MSEALPPSPPSTPKKSLTEVFNRFAADAVERFPHIKGQLLILELNEYRAYGNSEVDTKKTGLTKETALDYLSNHEVTEAMGKDKNLSSLAMRDPKHNINVIFMNEAVPEAERKNISKETEQHLLFVLDHELAHCSIKDGFARATSSRDYSILLAESVADAYALIRHYQRFGVDNDSKDKYVSPGGRADNFILGGDSMHFTSFILDAIAKRKHVIDFDKLDAKQTADLARRFALEYMPPKKVLDDLTWEFSAIRSAFKKNLSGGVQALIEKTLDPASDYYTFKLASLWLKPFMEDRTFSDGSPIKLSKEYLDDAAVKVKARQEKFEKEDILFDMPIKKAEPPKFAA